MSLLEVSLELVSLVAELHVLLVAHLVHELDVPHLLRNLQAVRA